MSSEEPRDVNVAAPDWVKDIHQHINALSDTFSYGDEGLRQFIAKEVRKSRNDLVGILSSIAARVESLEEKVETVRVAAAWDVKSVLDKIHETHQSLISTFDASDWATREGLKKLWRKIRRRYK